MAKNVVLNIAGGDWVDRNFYAEDAFVRVYNHVSGIMNDGVIDALNDAFRRFYPESIGDDAYAFAHNRARKEIADKMSKRVGNLLSGRSVYLDEEEPVQFNVNTGMVFLNGYIA